MARIQLGMLVQAPTAACYALALNVQAHLDSTKQTHKRVHDGPVSVQLQRPKCRDVGGPTLRQLAALLRARNAAPKQQLALNA